MTPRPPGTVRVLWLLTRLTARRFTNRLGAMMRKRWGARRGARSGTARKSPRSYVALVFVGALVFIQGIAISTLLLQRMTAEIHWRHLAPAEREAHAIARHPAGLLSLWPEAQHEEEMSEGLGVLFLVLGAVLVFSGLGTGSSELSQVGWSLEWLFTFPVRARSLFLARAGEYGLTEVFNWFTTFPLMLMVHWGRGFRWLAVPFALFGTLCLAAAVGSVRLVIETALRKRLSLATLKNVQAICTLFSMLGLVGILLGVQKPAFTELLLDAAAALPRAALCQPLSLPALGLLGPAWALAAIAGAAVAILLATALSARLVRNGLVVSSGTYQGRRIRREIGADRPPRLRGILGKEVRLLLRDRAFLVQTVATPLILVLLQVMFHEGLLRGAGGSLAPVFAFGVGAYVLAFGAFAILAVEGPSLWLLFSLPQPIHRLLRQKVTLWGSLACVYTAVVLALSWRPEGARSYVDALLALAGVVLFAFLGGGMGVLGTDPFEREIHRRARPEWSMLYLLLVSIFCYAIWTESLWSKFVLLLLTGSLVYAIWDRVRERLPLLLDPTQAPPPRIGLSDGLIACLVFFVGQRLAALALQPGELTRLTTGIFLCYLLSGAATVLFSLYVFWRIRVPGLLSAVGFRADRTPPRGTWAYAFLLGLAGAAGGRVYLLLIEQWDFLRRLREATPELDFGGESRLPMVALAVLAAPLVEEFLFRGLVFRGLRGTLGFLPAALLSAGIFAAVHAPVAFPPVFALGFLAALAFERTRLLGASVLVHAVYNASIVLMGIY